MDGVIGVHPGVSVVAPDTYTAWTGASGILDKLGLMIGGRVADPATPGSGNPGSPTTMGAQTSGVGPEIPTQKLIIIAGCIALGVFLLKKL